MEVPIVVCLPKENAESVSLLINGYVVWECSIPGACEVVRSKITALFTELLAEDTVVIGFPHDTFLNAENRVRATALRLKKVPKIILWEPPNGKTAPLWKQFKKELQGK